jgi:hypothetical protein
MREVRSAFSSPDQNLIRLFSPNDGDAIGADLPIPAVVRDASAIPLSQVTTKQPADHGESSTDDHEEHASRDSAGEVGKEEDNNSGVHQYCEHNSCDAPRHVLPPRVLKL